MAHQLYFLQTLTLGLLETRMNTKMDPQVWRTINSIDQDYLK